MSNRLKLWIALLMTGGAACSLVGPQPVLIRAEVRSPVPFAVKAAPKSGTDIDHYVFGLYNTATSTVVATYQTVATTCTFAQVPDGTYKLQAEAFDATNASITVGGAQLSSDTVTVTAPGVTYSNGSSLSTAISLLNGTGESVSNGVSVTNGSPWTGTPVGAP